MTFDLDRMIRKCRQLSENETNSQKKEMLNKVIEIFNAKSSYIVKMFAKKKFVQKMKNYTFLKSP